MRGRVVGVVVAGMVAAGCGSIAERAAEEVVERAAEQAGAGDVDVDLDRDGGVEIEGDDYRMDSNVGGLPDGWPDEIPLPAEFTVEGGFASEIEGRPTFQASGTFDGDCDPDFLAFLSGIPASWAPLEDFPDPNCSQTLVQAFYLDGTWSVAYSLIIDGDDRQFAAIVTPDETEDETE